MSHLDTQAVSPQDRAHMEKTDEDRRAEAEERAADQFGAPPAQSPDPYPEKSGNVVVEPRDESANEAPNGQSAAKSATNADDHQPKAAKKSAAKASSSSS